MNFWKKIFVTLVLASVVQNVSHCVITSVFCVDYNMDLDLVVSGSSDCTVKIWQMSTGSCLATKLGHQNWLISVSLVDPEILRHEETYFRLTLFILDSFISSKLFFLEVQQGSCIAY